MLVEVVVGDHDVPPAESKVFRHRDAGVGRQELHRRLGAGGRRDDDRVRERAVLRELLDHVLDRGLLLADRHINADDLLGILGIAAACVLLADEGVDDDRGLARLAIPNDQLTLAAPDRNHGVDGLDAGLDRLLHGLALHHVRRAPLGRHELVDRDRGEPVHRAAERVDHAADERLAHGHGDDAPRGADRVPFLDPRVRSQQNRSDAVLLEVERDTKDIVPEVQELRHHAALEAVDARDAVAHAQNGAHVFDASLTFVALDLFLEDRTDFGGAEINHCLSLRWGSPDGG